jgi:diguanylate cyclase (GGDEF)-like protein
MADYYQNLSNAEYLDLYYQNINKIGDYYIFFEEIDMTALSSPWYLVTMVNEASVDAQVSATMGTITVLLLEVGILVVLAFGLFLLDSGRVDRRQRKELERIAYVDPLTGGDNYACFVKKVSALNRLGYIVSMDLHAFKMINSVCGTERGDEVLRMVYRWICESASPEDIIAHVSADRFVMFFPRQEKEAVVQKISEISREILRETKKSNIPQVTAYYGITLYERGESVEQALSQANFARESAREQKDECYSFFDLIAADRIMNDKRMVDAFDEAMMNGEFEVWYQPKISPDTNKIVGAEALVRWRKEDGSLVPPGSFIPLYESNGMIRLLDEYVFRETCREQKRLLDRGFSVVPISVNLSRASIYSANLVERYKQIADEVGIDPKLTPIEITESTAVDENFMQTVAERFYQMGFPLQMDDFGSGYSSLASLNRMHFDALKLDKSLIDYIGHFGGDQLIKHTIALAKDLGMQVTAEGVEDAQQVAFLQQQNCDSIQGFYYSRPVPQAEYEELLGLKTSAA